MKRIEYTKGQLVGDYGITFIKEEKPSIESSGRKRRLATFLCYCGKKYKTRISDVVSNKSKSCGCSKGNSIKAYKNGDVINGVKFIKTLGTVNHAQRALFECPICFNEWESSVGNIQAGHTKSCGCIKKRGWSKTDWCSKYEVSFLYVVRLFDENESFIKIGITGKEVKHRVRRIPYNYEIIKIVKNSSDYIFDLENRLKSRFKKYQYKPKKQFKGYTECYKK